MTDRTKVILSAAAGTVGGAVVGYLLWTSRGLSVRDHGGPGLNEVLQRLQDLQASVQHARKGARQSASGDLPS
ncbi:MAG: hypothetical protein ACR2LU_05825 [Luteitalea sp.]